MDGDRSSDRFLEANRMLWDSLVAIHQRSRFYDLDNFLEGKSSLLAIEREEVGSVEGCSLLHLQCHFGMDTLSWARLGAQATGVDFSPRAIEEACALRDRLKLPAEFICCDLYDLPQRLEKRFQVVYTSYGVLCWLPDLPRWGRVVAHFLETGGRFVLVEGHPFLNVFANGSQESSLRVAYSYFHRPEPSRWEVDGDYADPQAQVNLPSYEWTHSLSDILNALLQAGLELESLREFPWAMYQCFPFLEQRPDGFWQMPGGVDSIPMLFSLRMRKK
ncbi:MAG: class I SAM-dependent methyltransferase [bacterium]